MGDCGRGGVSTRLRTGVPVAFDPGKAALGDDGDLVESVALGRVNRSVGFTPSCFFNFSLYKFSLKLQLLKLSFLEWNEFVVQVLGRNFVKIISADAAATVSQIPQPSLILLLLSTFFTLFLIVISFIFRITRFIFTFLQTFFFDKRISTIETRQLFSNFSCTWGASPSFLTIFRFQMRKLNFILRIDNLTLFFTL